jgi:predicted lipoprotein with Yx(FWY)xxD motif
MKIRILASAATLALSSACGGTDVATGAPEAGAGTGAAAIVTVADTGLGAVLTGGDGRTLYLFTVDEPGVSNCTGDCLAAWPPLLTEGSPEAHGTADASLVGTLTRDDGTVQVTYAGWPLYFFAGDAVPGDTSGQGVNGVWYAVAPDGTMVSGDPSVPMEDGAGDPGAGTSRADDEVY